MGLMLTWSNEKNLEQVANVLYAQANSAFYPQRNGVIAYLVWATWWWPSLADLGGGVSASCIADPTVC